MRKEEYYEILHEGLTEHRFYMADHIYRKWKEAEAEYISAEEYKTGIGKAFQKIHNEPFYRLAIPEFITAINSAFRKIEEENKPVGSVPQGNTFAVPLRNTEKELEFKDLFKDDGKFKEVVEILSRENYIDANSLIWKDEGKGIKGLLVRILKELKIKGYYNCNPSNEMYQSVCKNTFKVDVSIERIKRPGNHNTGFLH